MFDTTLREGEGSEKSVWPMILGIAFADLVLSVVFAALAVWLYDTSVALSTFFTFAIGILFLGEIVAGFVMLFLKKDRRLGTGLLVAPFFLVGVLVIGGGGLCLFMMATG